MIMANILSLFSARSLLVILLAINVRVLLRHRFDDTETPQLNEKWSPPPVAYEPAEAQDRVLNVYHGDPTMFERYWRQMGDKTTVVIPGWQFTSYFSDPASICWFMEPDFAKEILRLHQVVGNAVTEGRHLVVGAGSTQLLQAALFALSPQDAPEPMNVISAVPFYSPYPLIIDCVKAGIYKWAGDANSFDKDGPYIELVTSPNNPDGFSREAVVKRSGGIVIHDLAYYWPHYTPISSPADHDLSLFTVSKCTGHAGMRLGWALVKDKEVAKKMTKYIELTSLGVSKDSQHRAVKVLKAISDSCEETKGDGKAENFFSYGLNQMSARWELLREVVNQSGGQFSLPTFPPDHCNFFGKVLEPQPAFAWLRCEAVDDCEALLGSYKIMTRGGTSFGSSANYVRISMLDREENFNLFIKRLSTIKGPGSPKTAD